MAEYKVDKVKYPNLLDEHIEVHEDEDGSTLVVNDTAADISINAGTRGSYSDNWELAQEALSQAIEHRSNT